jgi:hypothetical protein
MKNSIRNLSFICDKIHDSGMRIEIRHVDIIGFFIYSSQVMKEQLCDFQPDSS